MVRQYLDLLSDVASHGEFRGDRTGTGTGRGTDQPTCTTAAQTGCAKLPDVIGTYSRGRSVSAQVTFRY